VIAGLSAPRGASSHPLGADSRLTASRRFTPPELPKRRRRCGSCVWTDKTRLASRQPGSEVRHHPAPVAQRPERELQAALRQLTDAGLLFCRGTAPHASYLFKHALLQDAAYGTLLRARRREMHARVAGVLEQRFPDFVETRPEIGAGTQKFIACAASSPVGCHIRIRRRPRSRSAPPLQSPASRAHGATNCARPRASPASGARRAGGARRASCSRPSTAGSPKASTHPI